MRDKRMVVLRPTTAFFLFFCLAFVSRCSSLEPKNEQKPWLNTKIGILYEGWHGYPSWAMSQVAAKGGLQLSVEQVLRSNGEYVIGDIFDKYDVEQDSAAFLWQVTPQLGFYCIYEKRWNETEGPIPDCSNIEKTLRQQARWLTSAGVDYVVVDSTNLPTFDNFSDVIQVRPTEVLFERWFALRLLGIKTPQIAVWAYIPSGANVWEIYLHRLYNDPLYRDLVMTDSATGKKVFFVVLSPDMDPSIISTIESNGGRNNVVVVQMWALFGLEDYSHGKWGFFSPCQANGGYTTSLYDPYGDPVCNQSATTNSPIGSQGTQLSVATSYQLTYGSLPFTAVGKFLGQTFKSQWRRAFELQPDYIFIASWNEFTSQPQPNPFVTNTGFNMGLPNDPNRFGLFLDTYGADLARDIEPSVEGGSYLYDVLASCIRVYRSGATTCSDLSEECCVTSVHWNNVWSFHLPGVDYVLSNSPVEAAQIQDSGYHEICNPYYGPSNFCVNFTMLMGQSGPFMLFAQETINSSMSGIQITTTPLYRCRESVDGLPHFISTDPNCEGLYVEYLLGYVANQRTTIAPRGLRRCIDIENGLPFHSLDIECPGRSRTDKFLGYVR